MKFRIIATGMVIMIAGISLVMPISVDAGNFTTNSLVEDTGVGMNVSTNPVVLYTAQQYYICGGANYAYNQGDECVVLVFQLPELGGEAIGSANLDFDGYREHENSWNVDLYGVRSSSSSANVSTVDYRFGPSPAGTLIQNDIMTPSQINLTWISLSTDATGDSNLANWLIAQYSAVGAGGYVFLCFNSDNVIPQLTGDGNNYRIALAEHVSQAHPSLTITTLSGTKGFEIITK